MTTPTQGEHTAPKGQVPEALFEIAREIEALKRPCGMDPESSIAVQNGRYMSLSYKVRALAAQVAALTAAPADTNTASGAADLQLADAYAKAHAMYCMEDLYGSSKSYTAELLKARIDARNRLAAALASAPAQPVAEPASCTAYAAHRRIEALIEKESELRRALEIIALGESPNPAIDAGDELVALGYWDADALAASHGQAPAGADQDGEAFRTAALLGLTLRFYGGCAQSGMPGTPSAYEVVSGEDRAAAMREAVERSVAVIAQGGESQRLSAAPSPQAAQQAPAAGAVAGQEGERGAFEAWFASENPAGCVGDMQMGWMACAARGASQPAPAPSVLEDAARWHWLAEYLVGPRTDLDDEIVASETVNDLRKLVDAARAAIAQQKAGE